jgi:CDP-diacylglycerol--glycerol-3-phosphate 3-phosphatidyltransferase
MNLVTSWVFKRVDAVLVPIARALVGWRVSPNTLTTVAFLTLAGAATAFAMGQVRLGGFLLLLSGFLVLLLSGFLDMLDGKVARQGGQLSRFGAFYDSTLDRLGEAALFGGIAIFFQRGGVSEVWVFAAVTMSMAALTAGLIVSYTRARAEGLQLDCKVGVGTRAERIVGLGAPSLFFGAGPEGLLLFGIISVIALLAVITVVQRIIHVYKLTRIAPAETSAAEPFSTFVDSLEKGSSSDRS